jgi:formate dehydrogenase
MAPLSRQAGEHRVWCGVCEAACGLVATVADGQILELRPDDEHPQSRGFACVKGIHFPEVLADPDRVRSPLRRTADGTFATVGWDDALDDIGARLRAVVREHGRESVGLGLGNPNGWNFGAFVTLFGMAAALRTRHFYTSSSVDINNYWVVSQLLYGNNLINPIPDFARTDFALILGANPVVSHGSMVTVGRIRETLLEIPKRGGRVVVVDPRRTETARLFEHVPILPGSDAWFVAGVLKVIVEEDLVDHDRLARQASGAAFALRLAEDVDLDRVHRETGIPPRVVRELGRELAAAPSAFVYGRCGASLGRFATLTKYLIDVVNIVTGNLDRPGGVVFARPMLDLEKMTKMFRANGYDRWRTRVDGIPEVLGTTPWAAFSREVTTPGPGQLRAMICVATNAATTSPASVEMERAFSRLDLFVSLDPYLTETNRHADYILPPALLFERESFPIFSQGQNTVPYAQWTPAIATPPPDVREDWWILDRICRTIGIAPSPAPGAQLLGRLGLRVPPHIGLDILLRLGPEGDLFGLRRGGLSRRKLLRAGGPVKLADSAPTGVLRKRLHTKDKLVHLEHSLMTEEMRRLTHTATADPAHPLKLFSIRELRSQNSWLHNIPRFVSGKRACRLRMHPDDARPRSIRHGATVRVASRWGLVQVPVELTTDVIPGSVGMNRHWGHHGGWTVAEAAGGARYNDLVPNDPDLLDVVSGNAWLNGIDVEVTVVDAGGPP